MKTLIILSAIFNICVNVEAFLPPMYKSIGFWILSGTSNKDHEDKCIKLYIMPENDTDNINIKWTKHNQVGPFLYDDSVQGKIEDIVCNEIECHSVYKFEAKKYTISVINILGIAVPNITIERPITDNCNQDVKWLIKNDVLFVKMHECDYVFTRNITKEKLSVVRLDHFILTQFLGYIFFKLIDKIHML